MYGKKHGLCKNCRNTMPKPRGGWRGKDGEHIKGVVFQCSKCSKIHGQSTRSDLPYKCPQCGSEDRKVIERW